MEPLTVCCVLRSGGCYTPEYVERLKAGIEQHLTDFNFVCLSDIDVPNRMPLVTDWPGWWAKLEIFRLKGRVLYFDLDTVITGDLTAIANYPHRFTMLRDFFFDDRLASGVMAWGGDYQFIFDQFDLASIDRYRRQPRYGDGGYIQDQVDSEAFQDILPGQILSRKAHPNRSAARVVCYHGLPRPHQTGWTA